jgi:hypothetical protein
MMHLLVGKDLDGLFLIFPLELVTGRTGTSQVFNRM